MEISNLETKTGAAKGAFLHLKHPALGHFLYTGDGADADGRRIDKTKAEPIGVHVMGIESERVREKARELSKAKLNGDDDAEEGGLAFVCSLVTRFTGLTSGGKPLEATEQAKREFFEQSDNFVEQVMDFAKNRANFWQGASTA